MKTIHLIILLLLLHTLPGCDKKLELAPENTLTDREVFRSEQGAEQALAEAYMTLLRAVTGNGAYVFADFTTENLHHSAYYDVFSDGELNPADETVLNIWTAYFKAINTANNIIANIPEYGNFSETKENQFIAESRFIRAYAYLDLLKMFGEGALTGELNGAGLPLQKTPFKGYNTGEIIPRSSNGDVFTQIKTDLEESIPFLPENHPNELSTRSRATKGSANALLARTALYTRNWDEAATAAEKVLESRPGLYDLAASLYNVFPENQNGTQQSMGKEHIFALPVSAMVSSSTSMNNNLGSGYFFKRSFWINQAFKASFEPGDLRVSELMFKGDMVYNPDRMNDYTTFKFNNPNGRDNVPLIRLAEIILIRAEALARTSGVSAEAVQLLNEIRSRSVPNAIPYTENDFNTPESLLHAILQQRRFELAFEGSYRYDLIRNGSPLRVPDIPNDKKVLPIPQMEIDISNGILQQNKGYQ